MFDTKAENRLAESYKVIMYQLSIYLRGAKHNSGQENYIHDQPKCISFNRASDHNAVYDNTITNCKTGVCLSNTGNNSIYNNMISRTENGIIVKNVTNQIYDNKISQSKNGIVFEPGFLSSRTNDIISTNSVTNEDTYKSYLIDTVDENHILDTKKSLVLKKPSLNSTLQLEEPNEINSTSEPDI